jgi:hypothetical protein
MQKSPKIFISYSHDSTEHQDWVYRLACRLSENGVDVILDQWDLVLGSNLGHFMESGLSSADRVIVVCTDDYNRKSNDLLSGVGYEKNIITAEILAKAQTTKFIPCIRGVTAEQKTPHCLSGRKYLDLSNDEELDRKITSLLHEIHGVPERPKPKIGPNPFAEAAESEVDRFASTVFFSNRFGRAFPGVRGIAWFREPQVALQRLQIFFQEPISSKKSNPIWWWRGGNSPIGSVHISPPDAVYLNDQELLIEEVAAVNTRGYFRQFLYIKTRSSAPSGLALSKTKTALLETGAYIIDQEGDAYVIEEFGLFRGRPITLAEYDDGSAVIDGQFVDVS